MATVGGSREWLELEQQKGFQLSLQFKCVEAAMPRTSFFIDASTIFKRDIGDSEMEVAAIFEKAIAASPCVLVIDEIDAICPSSENEEGVMQIGETESRVCSVFLGLLDSLLRKQVHVFVVGITNRALECTPQLFVSGRMDEVIEVPVLNYENREGALLVLLGHMRKNTTEDHRKDDGQIDTSQSLDIQSACRWLAGQTHGYVGADLLRLCREAAMVAGRKVNLDANLFHADISKSDWKIALKKSRPSSMRELVASSSLQPRLEKYSFASLQGVDELIAKMRETVVFPLLNRAKLKKLGVHPPKGILLHGPPGTGKTSLALALAQEVQSLGLANFLSVRCPDILSAVIGDSESSIAKLFERARLVSPCLLFLDQIEALAPRRGSSSTTENTMDRILSTLLVEMDGLHANKDDGILIIGVTNDISWLDPAIMRPGRFDTHLLVPLPDRDARKEILKHRMENLSIDPNLSVDDIATTFAKKTQGFSPAAIRTMCMEVGMRALRRDITAKYALQEDFDSAYQHFLEKGNF